MMHGSILRFVVFALFTSSLTEASDMTWMFGDSVGQPVTARRDGEQWILENHLLSARFVNADGHPRLKSIASNLNNLDMEWSDPNLFTVVLTGKGERLTSSTMKLAGEPRVIALTGDVNATRLTERQNGQMLRATFADPSSGLEVQWSAVLRNGANYLHQEIELRAMRDSLNIDGVEMFHGTMPGAKGTCPYDGMPVVADKIFFGIEHPIAQNQIPNGNVWTPEQMRARVFDLPLTRINDRKLEVRFDYEHGNHRIDIVKVAILNESGNVLAEDVHDGFSGHATSNNVYRLEIPTGVECGKLRVILGGKESEIDSWGRIAVTGGDCGRDSEDVCRLPRQGELKPGTAWKVSATVGVYPPQQLRRAFLHYLERERAHPYRQYWHYNSWYDLNIIRNDDPDPLNRMTEAQCLAVIAAFERELYDNRGVGLDGFVWDDGWDDWNSLWDFHKGFPNGFSRLKEAASRQGAGMGAWLSPWGGYGNSKNMRVKFGREKGYETNATGFALGGEKYYAAYRDTCLKMIRDYHQNYFKFDGIGDGTWATGAPVSVASDLDSLFRLIGDLRHANPDVFINCTVGTWPSPYWTWYADGVWRGGDDFNRAGAGNPREQWITYRDKVIYSRFVEKSPLYPLNSLMYHGPLVSPHAGPAVMPTPEKNIESFRHEVLMSVGCGSGVGELYITPALMTPVAWDILAAALKWSRAHQDILRDVHWIGGKPDSEVYGYAAWHPKHGGTLVLRNPTDQPQKFVFNAEQAFEIPVGMIRHCELTSVLNATDGSPYLKCTKEITLEFAPFEVRLYEAKVEK